MATIHCASHGLKEMLMELSPEHSKVLEQIPICSGGTLIDFDEKEKEQSSFSKFTEKITKPISGITAPVEKALAPVTKPVSKTTEKVVKPMIKPIVSLAEKVAIGTVVSLIVFVIVKKIKK